MGSLLLLQGTSDWPAISLVSPMLLRAGELS